jgi:hypothetical protein
VSIDRSCEGISGLFTKIQLADPLESHQTAKAVTSFRDLIGACEGRPQAILWRQVATPNYELRSFLRASRRHGLEPIVLTFSSDRMSNRNAFKRTLVAPMFVEGINRSGQPIWRRRRVLNVDELTALRISEIKFGKIKLPGFHMELLEMALPNEEVKVLDISEWIEEFHISPEQYYLSIFLSLTDGTTLFENFVTDSEEGRFAEKVINPAFSKAREIIGCDPMIVPLCCGRRASSALWYAYPDSYRAHFEALGVRL